MSDYSKQLSAAIPAVRAAARVCQTVQAELVSESTLEKKDKSPVTVADFASQAIVCAHLQNALPNDQMVAEEDAAALREADQAGLRAKVVEHVGREIEAADEAAVLGWIDRGNHDGSADEYWTLDPIDGTKGFLRGEQYAIALALVRNGKVVLGVLGCPNLPGDGGKGVLMVATAGGGTKVLSLDGDALDGRPANVSDLAAASDARFCESVESGHSDQDQSAQIAKKLGITAEPVRMDSQAKYASVARGDASIYLRLPTRKGYIEKIWDHAAGMICMQEAGGRVTDIHGKDLDFSHGGVLSANEGVVATNGPIHDEVLAAVDAVFISPTR